MVKYRLGGSLKDIKLLSLDIATEVIFRLKEMSALKTDVTDKVQKGNIVIETDKIAEDKKFDIKVSIIPAFYGERIAMRIVSVTKIETTTNRGFEILAFQGHDLEQVQKIFNKHFGLIIITGLSGSGKTTTCYAALNYLVKRYAGKANIMSLENPVEYPLEGLVQIPVRPEMEGQGFYELLKASWDQDPDVIFTGELPDKNTARIISELALTGHIVIVQMDSPDVLQAVARLSDLGLEPYLLASSLEGVIAQRLVRCICEHCKEEFIPSPQIIEKYFPPMKEKVSLYRGKGCKECHGTGYKKRAGIYEILNPDTDFKEALARGENVNNLKKILQKKGFETLREKALKSALFGMTTLEEALRVSYSS